jgi:hypothetical protein
MLSPTRQLPRQTCLLLLCVLVAACSSPKPVVNESIQSYVGKIPVNLTGSWERDYSRGDDINVALNRAFGQLRGTSASAGYPNDGRTGGVSITQSQADSVVALARLAELITRQDVYTITQSNHDISIERKDDFAIFCEFYDGQARGAVTDYGSEVCGWDRDQFISQLVLPDDLLISHRFTMGPNGERLRVITTVSSRTARVPFVLDRYYRKFEPSAGEFNCVETLSMNRVCSTSELELIP